jgi:hypothetical protein
MCLNEWLASSVKAPMPMKSKLLLGIALVTLATPAFARFVRFWSNDELLKASDLVVIAMPISTTDLDETNALGWTSGPHFTVRFRGVETTLKVIDVFKGMPKNDRIILHHYRDEITWGSPPNAPVFVSFPPATTNLYLLYLTNDGPDRYAPATGQIDPWGSVKSTTNISPRMYMYFGFPRKPPIADADPSICHPVAVLIPTRLQVRTVGATLLAEIDPNSIESTNLLVGTNMIVGTETETEIYPADNPKLERWVGGSMGGGAPLLGGSVWASNLNDKLIPGKKYVIEADFTLFETDIPPQHMWEPSGSKYKILWRQTLKQTVQSP